MTVTDWLMAGTFVVLMGTAAYLMWRTIRGADRAAQEQAAGEEVPLPQDLPLVS